MRILVVAWMNPTTTDYPLFLIEQWRKMGHEVRAFPFDIEVNDEPIFGWLNRIENCWIEMSERRIERACREFKPDILLLMYYFMRGDAINRVKRRYRCVVGSYLDNNHLMLDETMRALSVSDFIILHDSYLVPLVSGNSQGRCPNVFFMSCMAEPSEHKPVKLSERDRKCYGAELAFIGGSGEYRASALRRLTRHDLRIWGPSSGWDSHISLRPHIMPEPVYGLKKTKIYNASLIVLSIEEPQKQLNSTNNRIPETLACGGFVLCNWSKDLEDTGLRDGESVAWFTTPQELEAKVMYYLSRREARESISACGREIVLRSLTYERTAARLAEQMIGVVEQRNQAE